VSAVRRSSLIDYAATALALTGISTRRSSGRGCC